ncbi:iron export ABC transporter permease subunit FetB [Vibrio europaeus]|uniref:ABC transporter permease n=1 Tax=Vibrio europaeus TaxID=300876 RepID=UPI0018A725F6|nr:iron export ABC transporter permease subunit FetB [Vibrio europaeus]MDC5810618.1 iron export ABC transporter permease subunit FetB [Vibrio europaeus]QPG37387.1 iron export ABC transporter permease subunit FetB [Vibrio europaeus]
MDSVVDISWSVLALFFSLLVIPLLISQHYKLKIGNEIIESVTRMTLQLLMVGFYLQYLFKLNSLAINALWLVLMTLIGASAIIGKAKLPKKALLLPVTIALTTGLFPMLTVISVLVIQPQPLYSAQYMIPLAGMLLGNSMSGNIVALQNVFTALDERKSEYEAAISLGASPKYATLPFVQDAMRRSLAPTLATMSTTGLVTLPGMMTGQILGGASPLVAIKYQILIMVAILVMMSLSVMLSLQLTIKKCINNEGRVLVKIKSVD